MSDDIDRAEQQAIAYRRPVEPPDGRCHGCLGPAPAGQLCCSRPCVDSYDAALAVRARNGFAR